MNLKDFDPVFDSSRGFYMRNVAGMDVFDKHEMYREENRQKDYLKELMAEYNETAENNLEICKRIAELQWQIDHTNPVPRQLRREYSLTVQTWILLGDHISNLQERIRENWEDEELDEDDEDYYVDQCDEFLDIFTIDAFYAEDEPREVNIVTQDIDMWI